MRSWTTDATNFSVSVVDLDPGAEVSIGYEDEIFLLLASGSLTLTAEEVSLTIQGDMLAITPPGTLTVTCLEAARFLQVVPRRNDASDERAADVVPLPSVVSRPSRPVRVYDLAKFTRSDSNMRLFQTADLMINVLTRRETPRDTNALSPHSHEDFEQASVVLEGRYVHHLRYPWTSDLSQWRNDEAWEVGAPSVAIIPPTVVHTSRNIGGETGWLIDVFAPPRSDFLTRPGLVNNACDYGDAL